MDPSRVVLAALTWSRGARAYADLAKAAWSRAGVDWLVEPWVLARALGYVVVPIMILDDRCRADVRGSTIRNSWQPEHVEDSLNVYYGIALALLREAQTQEPTETQIWGVTVALALPEAALEFWNGHPHVPPWFVDLRVAARRRETGVRAAIERPAVRLI